MFVGEARFYPSETSFRYSTLGWAPGLTHKHKTRLERLGRDKHYSLLQKSVNYGQKSFITLAPGCAKLERFHFQSLTFGDTARSLPLRDSPGYALALSANSRLGWKLSTLPNSLA
jgi:hypothetical protein